MHRIALYALVLSVVVFSACSPEPADAPIAQVQHGVATKGMVSSAHPIATRAGIDVFKRGGNAFDAAVAVAATLNVVEPAMSGIGGYGTILIYDAESGRVRFLDSSGRIPRNLDSDVFRPPTPDHQGNRRGPKAVSTPGNVNAWASLSENYGRLDWHELFEFAIRAARDGFELDERGANLIAGAFESFPEHARAIYGMDDGALGAGETLIQEDLAASLQAIAKKGPEVLYGGKLGQAIDLEMRSSGGVLTLDDLIQDSAEWWEPIGVDYRGHHVFTASPPSTAFPSLIRLGIMSRFDVAADGHNSVATLHRFCEATKHAFWCRLRHAGDPDVSPPPLDELLSEPYWDEISQSIDMKSAQPFSYPELESSEDRHTTHFVVADRWGNIVSATQTLGNAFGSRIMPEGTGIWLNNSLAYCTFEPKGNPMDAHPGRRKLSGDCPTIILRDNRPWAALGTPGGHTIGQTVPQMVMNLIDFEMDIQEAIAAPRLSFVEPDLIVIEAGVGEETIETLRALGHNIRVLPTGQGLGNAHGLTIEYGEDGRPWRFFGGADPRGAGLAAGF
jgi:gamma-glutamyltranspeptidase/glutathione hydrolase